MPIFDIMGQSGAELKKKKWKSCKVLGGRPGRRGWRHNECCGADEGDLVPQCRCRFREASCRSVTATDEPWVCWRGMGRGEAATWGREGVGEGQCWWWRCSAGPGASLANIFVGCRGRGLAVAVLETAAWRGLPAMCAQRLVRVRVCTGIRIAWPCGRVWCGWAGSGE